MNTKKEKWFNSKKIHLSKKKQSTLHNFTNDIYPQENNNQQTKKINNTKKIYIRKTLGKTTNYRQTIYKKKTSTDLIIQTSINSVLIIINYIEKTKWNNNIK